MKAVERERALVIGGDAGSLYTVTWAFVLEPLDDSDTRLLARPRRLRARLGGLLLRLVGHPIHFAMQRRQLLSLKRRVETAAA